MANYAKPMAKTAVPKMKKGGAKKKFKPHMMYDPKTGKGYKAKVMADHTRMKKKGYGHTKPKMKMGGDKADSAAVLGYFNDLKQARKGAMMSSYDNYMKTGGAQQCGKPGKPRCFKKSGSRFGKFISKHGKKILGTLGAGAVAGLTAGAIRKAKKNKNNNINPGSGGPGFFENMFGG